MNKSALLISAFSILFLLPLSAQQEYAPNDAPYQIEAFWQNLRADYASALKTSEEGLQKICIEQRSNGTLCHGCYYIKMGISAEGLADYCQALEYFQLGLDCYLQSVGENHGLPAHSYLYIVKVHYSLGEYELAKKNLWKALERSAEIWGNSHWETAKVFHEIGKCLLKMGDYSNALTILNRGVYAEDIINRGIQRAEVYNQFCEFILETNEVPHSLENVRSTLEKLDGTSSPETSTALFFAQKVVKIWQADLGENHPDMALALKNVGLSNMAEGGHEKALPPLSQALETLQLRLSGNHPLTADVCEALGIVFEKKEIRTPHSTGTTKH